MWYQPGQSQRIARRALLHVVLPSCHQSIFSLHRAILFFTARAHRLRVSDACLPLHRPPPCQGATLISCCTAAHFTTYYIDSFFTPFPYATHCIRLRIPQSQWEIEYHRKAELRTVRVTTTMVVVTWLPFEEEMCQTTEQCLTRYGSWTTQPIEVYHLQ